MWKVATEDLEGTDRLSVRSAWLLIQCQGAVDSPLGISSHRQHICSPHTSPAQNFPSPDCLLLLRRGHTWFQRPRVSCKVQGWMSLQKSGRASPLSGRQHHSAKSHFPELCFLCLWILGDTAPLSKRVCTPWRDPQQPNVYLTERLDKSSCEHSAF